MNTTVEIYPPSDSRNFEGKPNRKGYAVVGLGELALGQILPAFAAATASRPIALVSGHKDKAAKVAGHYGINPKNIYNYETFDELKNNEEVEIVYIVLPNSMHAEFTIRALKAGKHVLCEKPMAVTVAECEEMISVAKEMDKKIMIAYRLRYEPFNQKMIQLAKGRSLGELKLFTSENIQNVKAPDIRLSRALGGGPLGDIGIYCLNAARYITAEEPTEVAGMAFQSRSDPRFEEVPERIVFQ